MQSKTQQIEDLLNKGVEKIIDEKHFKDALISGKKLRIKHGIDPTGDKIHLGRASQLWKLKDFQDLGHRIVLVIGDFTAQIGDPSDKPDGRKGLTEKEIKKNMASYIKQFDKILDIKKTEIRYNSEWFKKIGLDEFLSIAKIFSVQQMVHRRNFNERWKKEQSITLQEIYYPLLQGYDSVALKADAELGGYDQLFNLKTGRDIQKHYGQKPQDIMALRMLSGLDGRKMSTSWGNVVNISDEPKDMFGKIMSMKDEMMEEYFEICARLSEKELQEVKKKLKDKKYNPKDLKEELALKIVSLYWGEKKAEKAKQEFEKVFKDKGLPSDIRVFFAPKKEYPILELLFHLDLAKSKGEAKRLIQQGGARIDSKKITDFNKIIKVEEGLVIQAGKRNFARLTLKDGREE
ncbi:tyrosine--tRNA ligase [Patescibacteria group bacterium]|nr:tyrosine--tRNA ligase [Patescibacteria group bacterium]MBU4078340.1 tyrosine--tRNA ligase [Patescibacteria group bacterium]